MINFFIIIGSLILLLMGVGLFRLMVGPTPIDRLIAVNIIGAKTTAVLVIIGFINGKIGMFVDLALAYAMLNFLTSMAAARLLSRESLKNLWGSSL